LDWVAEFRLWLIQVKGDCWNLGYESIIPRLAFPDEPHHWERFGPRSNAANDFLCKELFRRLREFDSSHPESPAAN
jgi:hypothetical protein